jgi:DNA mismatch endonuclease (patch repair protein)
VHTPEQRTFNMSRVRGRDTQPEMLIRRGLHARGYRFSLQRRDLPGRPDIVFPAHRAVILIHGCFWHCHNCPLFRQPVTRAEFWSAKFDANRARDAIAAAALSAAGWRQLIVWECALRGHARQPVEQILTGCETFLRGDLSTCEIAGAWNEIGLSS